MTKRRSLNWSDIPHRGKGVCGWCGQPVPKGRRSWCSQACVDEYLIRSRPAYAREKVMERDHGVCGECGFDTEHLRRELEIASDLDAKLTTWRCLKCETDYMEPPAHGVCSCYLALMPADRRELHARGEYGRVKGIHNRLAFNEIVQRLQPLGWTATDAEGSLWQADHVVPVVEGGGGCGLDNLRTLCTPCHKKATAALAARRAHTRRAEKKREARRA
jgi:5-methylcytosine-specific restriction protein A